MNEPKSKKTPNVIPGGSAGFRIRREGDPEDDREYIRCLEAEVEDFRRRIHGDGAGPSEAATDPAPAAKIDGGLITQRQSDALRALSEAAANLLSELGGEHHGNGAEA